MAKVFSVVKGAEIVIGNIGTATNTTPAIVPDDIARMLGPDVRAEFDAPPAPVIAQPPPKKRDARPEPKEQE